MCGCGGSNRLAAREQVLQRREAAARQRAENPRPERGPQDPGYFWTGPKRGKAKA